MKKKEEPKHRIDILNRDDFINQVLHIITLISSNKGNLTFAINGSWGCGKTFVLNEIENRLSDAPDSNYVVIHYNCWQYDYYDEPLVAIVSELYTGIENAKCISNEEKKKAKEVLKQVGKSFLSLSAHLIEKRTGFNIEKGIEEVLKIAGSKKTAEKDAKAYDTYDYLKIALNCLIDELSVISEKSTIVFCVDELDRCLPEYAIKVLERLHHLTENTQNTVSIIAVDKKRLDNTVNSIFGEKAGGDKSTADDYLKKFIRFEIKLDQGKQNGKMFFEKFPELYSRFDESLLWPLENTEKFLEELFYGIDARSQEQIVEKALMLNDICFGENKQDSSIMYMELFIATLYYYYNDDSINDNDKTVKSLNVFSGFSGIPEHFKYDLSGFNCENTSLEPDIFTNRKGIRINISDVYRLVFLYWYYSVELKRKFDRANDFYPIVFAQDEDKKKKLNDNIDKIKKYVSILSLIS